MRTYFPDHADVELTVKIEGPAREVLAALKRMGSTTHCNISGFIRARIVDSANRRRFEPGWFPEIENGDAAAAMEKLDNLARQRLIDAEIERELDDVIPEFRALTRRRKPIR